MQVGESLRKIELLAGDTQTAKSKREDRRSLPSAAQGQPTSVDIRQIAYASPAELQESGDTTPGGIADRVPLDGTPNPQQHVMEMHADIRRYSVGPLRIVLPGSCMPSPGRRDVNQLDVADPIRTACRSALPDPNDFGMETQLHDRPHATHRRAIGRDRTVCRLRSHAQRFLADRIGHGKRFHRNICGMEVIGRAYRLVVDRFPIGTPPESRRIGRKIRIGKRTVLYPRVLRLVVHRDRLVSRSGDSLPMPRNDISGHSGDRGFSLPH